MSPPDPLPLGPGVAGIELVGSVVLAGYVTAAVAGLVRGRGVAAARLLVAEGAVMALTFKSAAALLKAVEVQGWQQIGMFAVILGLRTLLKQVFGREAARLRPA